MGDASAQAMPRDSSARMIVADSESQWTDNPLASRVNVPSSSASSASVSRCERATSLDIIADRLGGGYGCDERRAMSDDIIANECA